MRSNRGNARRGDQESMYGDADRYDDDFESTEHFGDVKRASTRAIVRRCAVVALIVAAGFGAYLAVRAMQPKARTAIDYFDSGTALVASSATLEEGIEELLKAHELAPDTEGLRPILHAALVRRVEILMAEERIDDAFERTAQLSRIDITGSAAELIARVQRLHNEHMIERLVDLYPSDGQRVPEAKIVVRGRITSGTEIKRLQINGVPVPLVAESFSHPTGILDDGPQTVTIEIEDSFGTVHVRKVNFVVDTRAPKNKFEVTGDDLWVARRFTVKGTVIDDSPVTVTANGSTISLDNKKKWEMDLELKSDGPQAIEFTFRDSLGREFRDQLTVRVDGTAPTLDDGGRSRTVISNEIQPVIECDVRDEHLKSVFWDDRPIEFERSGRVRIPIKDSEKDGWVTHRLTAVDTVGNALEPQEFKVRVDRTAPTYVLEELPKDVLPSESFVLRGVLQEGDCKIVRGEKEAEAIAAGPFELPFTVPDDARIGATFEVSMNFLDAAGNRSVPLPIKFPVVRPCPTCGTDVATRGQCKTCSGNGSKRKVCKECENGQIRDRPCTSCAKTGFVACRKCNREKIEPNPPLCDSCGGDGRQDCPNCDDGTNRITCRLCAGRGWVEPLFGINIRRQTCPRCSGGGQETANCTTCKHSGTIICRASGCENGRTRTPCKQCGGSGNSATPCPNCKRGFIWKPHSSCQGSGTAPDPCKDCKASGQCKVCNGTARAKP